MFILHPFTQIVTRGEKLCVISDDREKLTLHTAPKQLPVLLKYLLTGLKPQQLWRILDPQEHPRWQHQVLWNKLSPFLIQSKTPEPPNLDSFSEHCRYPAEVTIFGQNAIWARQQQVIHLPVLSNLVVSTLHLLIQAGFEAFISYDTDLVTSRDLGFHFGSHQLGKPKTTALSENLVAKNSNVVMASPAIFSQQNLGPNHHILWHTNFSTAVQQQAVLARSLTAGLTIIPLRVGSSVHVVGPLLRSTNPPCWDCYQRWSAELTSPHQADNSHVSNQPTAQQSALISATVMGYLHELTQSWFDSTHQRNSRNYVPRSTQTVLVTENISPVTTGSLSAEDGCVCNLVSQHG